MPLPLPFDQTRFFAKTPAFEKLENRLRLQSACDSRSDYGTSMRIRKIRLKVQRRTPVNISKHRTTCKCVECKTEAYVSI